MVTVLLSLIAGFLYRVGGMSKEEAHKAFPFLPNWFINTNTRDIGVPLLTGVWLALHGVAWWRILVGCGLMIPTLKTYWDGLFGFDNFYFSGFMTGFALMITSVHWWGWMFRALLVGVVWELLNILTHKYKMKHSVWIEEIGRGVAVILTLGMLLL